MRSNEQRKGRTHALFFLCLALAAPALVAQEPKIPEGPPPPELVGRWLEKTSDRKGDFAGYNIYFFSRKSEFLVVTRVRNEKTKTWVNSKKLYPKDRPSLLGYFEARPPNILNFKVVVLAMAVLPLEMKYSVRGQTLSLSKNIFDPRNSRGVKCERIDRLPEETKAEAAALQKRIEGALNGADFRQVFEEAAREMKNHPTDEAMISNFDDHREQFESLRGMMQADKGLQRIDFDWTKPDDPATVGVPPERLEQYRGLCKKVGLERGVEAVGDSATRVAFLASCRGLSVSGSSKSYVWLSTPPEPTDGRLVVLDVDAYVRQRQEERARYFKAHQRVMSGHVDAYRHIEGNWYLHYED